MKILIVCSGNVPGDQEFDLRLHHAFIHEQTQMLQSTYQLEFDFFFIKGKGIFGYLKNYSAIKKKIRSFKPDIIHAYFGLSGLLACLQNQVPLVVSYLGCDINTRMNRFLSKIAMRGAQANIFVSENLLKIAAFKKNVYVIPFGINLKEMSPLNKSEARRLMNFSIEDNICLFSSSRLRKEKNFNLAQKAINIAGNIKLFELEKGYSKDEINLMINSSDFLLLTSFREGSPQVIKEAMACNCPIVSTDVGDIKWVIGNTEGCYLTTFDPKVVAEKLKMAIEFAQTKGRTNGRDRIIQLGLDAESVAKKVLEVYQKVLNS